MLNKFFEFMDLKQNLCISTNQSHSEKERNYFGWKELVGYQCDQIVCSKFRPNNLTFFYLLIFTFTHQDNFCQSRFKITPNFKAKSLKLLLKSLKFIKSGPNVGKVTTE